MNGSMVAVLAIAVVAVIALAFWLISVYLAARRPHQVHAHGERLRGQVQGGMHVGGGRSVSPRRDEEVVENEVPGGDTLHPDPAHPEHVDSDLGAPPRQ